MRRYLDPKNIHKTPSQEVFGRLGSGKKFKEVTAKEVKGEMLVEVPDVKSNYSKDHRLVPDLPFVPYIFGTCCSQLPIYSGNETRPPGSKYNKGNWKMREW